jgi:uncharacterized lipoprotein YehR (DUF1307 family)
MKKYLLLMVAVVFAAGLCFAETGGQTKTTAQQSGGTAVQSTTTTQPASVEKTFEGTIVWVKAGDKVKKTSAAMNVMGTDNKALTFVVKGGTVIEGKDKTQLKFSSLKKNEKVMVTYKVVKERNVADTIVLES